MSDIATHRSVFLCSPVYPAILLARVLRAGQQEHVIRPRLAGEGRKLLRHIVPGCERPDYIHVPREGPVQEPPQVNHGVYREGPHIDCSPDARDLQCLGPVFRNLDYGMENCSLALYNWAKV